MEENERTMLAAYHRPHNEPKSADKQDDQEKVFGLGPGQVSWPKDQVVDDNNIWDELRVKDLHPVFGGNGGDSKKDDEIKHDKFKPYKKKHDDPKAKADDKDPKRHVQTLWKH